MDIIAGTGLKSSTIDGALRRMLKRKALERVSRGVYKLIFKFQKIIFQIHVFQTNEKKKVRSFDVDEVDLQCSLEGTIPVWFSDQEIEESLFDRAVEQAELLFFKSISEFLGIDITRVEWTVIGIEKQTLVTAYNKRWDSELVFENRETGFFEVEKGSLVIELDDL